MLTLRPIQQNGKKTLCALLAMLSMAAPLCARTVKASDFGFNAEDATSCLQQALDSKASKVIVDYQGKDWMVTPIFLNSDQEVIFEDKVVIRAKKNAFKAKTDCLFTAIDKKNITLKGLGKVSFIMNKRDYRNPSLYAKSEWRHIIRILSSENIRISNLTLMSSGGDGIYLGNNWKNKRLDHVRNTLIENVMVTDQHRQGISVISAENLTIRNCIISNTGGTPPAAGIDFEPNGSSERLVNCLLDNCQFLDNCGAGMEFYLNTLRKRSLPVSITVRDCLFRGNAANMRFMQGKDPDLRATLTVDRGSMISQGRQNVNIMGLGPQVTIKLKDIRLENRKNPDEAIVLQSAFSSGGKLNCDNLILEDSKPQCQPFAAHMMPDGTLPPITLTGQLSLNGQKHDLETHFKTMQQTMSSLFTHLRPVSPDTLGRPPRTPKLPHPATFRIRSNATFLHYFEKGEQMKITVTARAAGRNKSTVKATLVNPSGQDMRSCALTPGQIQTIQMPAPITGVYRIVCKTGRNLVTVTSDTPGHGLLPEGNLNLFCPKGMLYFEVPAGLEQFSMLVSGNPGEHLTAAIIDAEGRIAAERKHFSSPHIFTLKRKRSNASEIWSIRFEQAVEDVCIRPDKNLMPIFASDPAMLLRNRQSPHRHP